MMSTTARIYLRRNGSYGSSCDGIEDTGHRITKGTRDFFTVWSVHDEDRVICRNATRSEAETAIAADWHTA
jgi:hypothetical protein